MLLYITFFSSRRTRGRQDGEDRPKTIKISVPSELVMDLLSKGAILQLQMGPVPLRPNLARPASSPERPDSRPEPAHMRPNVPEDDPRPNPPGRSAIDPPRPERPVSRCPPTRLVSRPPVDPFTDWSSLSHSNNAQDEVISIHSSDDDDDYVPKSPMYEPDSPGPVSRPDPTDQNPGPDLPASGPSRTVKLRDEERPRSPLGRGNFLQMVSPFLRGQRK